MTRISVVDHGAGNLVSIAQGLRVAGAEVKVAETPDGLTNADGIVLPGVGTTGAAMARLRSAGFIEPLETLDRPLLGICVGLQLFFDASDEDDNECLGLMPGRVRRLDRAPLLPHIGWNDVTLSPDPLFAGVPSGTTFYFVHSFAPVPDDPSVVIGTSEYGEPFTAAARSGNRVGVQFHPERSGPAGLRVLSNFVALAGGASRAA